MDNLMELSKLFGVPVDTLLRPDAELMPKAEDSDESWPGAENQPVRNENRKWKIAAIAAAGLLCVSVVCSAVSLWRVLAMQQQIDTLRMQSGPSTIYYPDNTSAENSDLADWSENVTVDRENNGEFSCDGERSSTQYAGRRNRKVCCPQRRSSRGSATQKTRTVTAAKSACRWWIRFLSI